MNGLFLRRSLVALVLMAVAAWLASAAKPNVMLADVRPPVSLHAVVPESFGEWHMDKSAASVMVEPSLQRAIDAVYAQTISRVYVNSRGQQIMLAVAYGRDQSDTFQVHLPEGCYQGQGFAINAMQSARLATRHGAIPVEHMVAERDKRLEAVTYWVVVGNRFGTDEWERKKIKLSYALKRTMPDGILIRVSSIGRDTSQAFELQQRFIDAMLDGVPAGQRQTLLGEQHS